MVIDNRPGAGGNLGTELAAKAPADGYTILMGTVANAISTTLYLALARKASAFMPRVNSPDAEGILAFDGCK